MSLHISRRDLLKGLATLPFLGFVSSRLPVQVRGQKPNSEMPSILILVFDALSAHHVSLYGYHRDTTPNLARFAARTMVYHRHYAGGNFTSPGVASLLTGTYPWSHRALHMHGTVSQDYEQKNLFTCLAPDLYYSTGYSHNLLVTSLLHQFHAGLDLLKRTRELCLVDDEFADRLFPNDYNVAFYSEWLLMREGKYPPGSLAFSLLHRILRLVHKKMLPQEVVASFPRGVPSLHNLRFVLEDAIDWLQDYVVSAPRPFLMYAHMLPPHEPYTTRRDFIDRFADGWAPLHKQPHFFSEGNSDASLAQQRREYDEYIAYADAEFGRLYDNLVQMGILDNTYVIVTSDHGELFERGIRGHVTPVLYEPVIRVPLLISKPGQQQREDVYTPTSAVDLLPTLLQLAGQPIPGWCEGEVLPPFSAQETTGSRNVYVVEAKSNPKGGPLNKATLALIQGQFKLVHYLGYKDYEDEYELYDLANDPEELTDLYPSGSSVAGELQGRLDAKLQQVNQPYLRD